MFLTNEDSDQFKAFELDTAWDLTSFDVSDNLEMYLSTGLDSTWTREDVVAGFKVTW